VTGVQHPKLTCFNAWYAGTAIATHLIRKTVQGSLESATGMCIPLLTQLQLRYRSCALPRGRDTLEGGTRLSNPADYLFTLTAPWPAQLLADGRNLATKYGILDKRSPLPKSATLSYEMDSYEKWNRTPLLATRPLKFPALNMETLRGHKSTVSRYLAFCEAVCGVPREDLTLELFSNQQFLADFMGVILARSGAQGAVNNFVRLERAATFVACTSRAAKASPEKVIDTAAAPL
jgi:hypothetical protein